MDFLAHHLNQNSDMNRHSCIIHENSVFIQVCNYLQGNQQYGYKKCRRVNVSSATRN